MQRETLSRMDVDPEFEAILKKWGSEKAVYAFLRQQFDLINKDAFGGRLTMPDLLIKPMWLSKGLMGERNSGADYEPAEGNRSAEIGVFTCMLADEDTAHLVLAHEMIHHWENTVATDNDSEDYPAVVDEEISKGFSTGFRERSWRRAHSKRFISKACVVAKVLSIPIRQMLFGH